MRAYKRNIRYTFKLKTADTIYKYSRDKSQTLSTKISTLRVNNYIGKYSYLLLLIPVFLVAYPLLSLPGIPIGNGDLPYIELSLFPDKKLWTWNEYGSYHGMEVLPRYPIIGLFNWMDLPPDITSKFLIIGLFAIASFSFYFSAIRLFKTRLDVNTLKFRMMTVAGSLFYAYNVWSFHRIGHWYFWLGYALLPLFFISVIYAFRYPKRWKYVLASAFLWSVASSSPHMTIFFGIVFAGLCAKWILCYIRKKNRKILLLHAARPIATIMLVYISVNLYWIYPYLNSSQSENFQWSAAVTEQITEELSRESNFQNVIRLLEGTFNMGKINVFPAEGSAFNSIWLLASFVVPVISFAALIWWKRNLFRYALFFSVLSVIGIFLTMGTNAPFNLYSILLFYTPVISNLQILFREPDKWGFLVAFGFSFLIVISGFNILNKLEHLPHKKITSSCFAALLLVGIAVYFYPAFRDSTENLYRPVVLPEEFKNLNNQWTSVGADKTFLMPYAPYNTTWGKDKGTLDLYSAAAPVPNLAPSDYNNVEKYYKYLANSIVRNKTYSVEDMIYPLGTSYITYHNDSLMPRNEELLEKLMVSLDKSKPVKENGLFKIFSIGDNEKNIGQAEMLPYNALVVGGLDRLASMSFVPYFSTINSSLIFLDQQIKNEISIPPIKSANSVILKQDKNDFILSFLEDKYILQPYEETNHHEPSKVWSKAGSSDPGNAWFTPYLENFGMENWDFDYGKGLVITEAMGAKLSMPISLPETDRYDIFLRFLKNQKGGIINVYLDDKLVQQVNTMAESSNEFVWQEITNDKSPNYLAKGEHTITLENVAGFNAVNIFGIIPSTAWERLEDNVYSVANRMKNVFLLEAESSFLNDGGNSSAHMPYPTDHYYLLKYQNNGGNETATNRLFAETATGQFETPTNKELMYLQLRATGSANRNNATDEKNDSNTSSNQSYYLVKNLGIFSTQNQSSNYVFDFENKHEKLPLAVIRQLNPNPYDDLCLVGQNTTVSQNECSRIVVKQGNGSDWNIESTDFIPVYDISKSIQYNLSISAEDVKQLHSKVVYYDANKNETTADFISNGRDGTFKDTIAGTLPIPDGTKFLKLQVLSAPNPAKESSYNIDKLGITPLSVEMWKNYDDKSIISLDTNTPISGKGSLRVDLERQDNNDNRAEWSIIATDLIPVNDKSYYNMSMSVSSKNVKQLHSKVVYYDSNKEHIRNLENLEEANEIVFPGTDGTFSRSYKFNPSIPLGTKYIQLQMFVSPIFKTGSSYLVDNLKIEEIVPEVALFDNDFGSFDALNGSLSQNGRQDAEAVNSINDSRKESTLAENDDIDESNNSLRVSLGSKERGGWLNKVPNLDDLGEDIDKRNNNDYPITQTKPIPVRPGSTYNYSISIEGQNLDHLAAIAYFKNGSNVLENSTRYGPNASSGSVLSLSHGSEVYTNVDILKPADYSVALRASMCESCSFVRLTIEDKHNDKIIKTETISLKQDSTKNKNNMQLNWIWSNNSTWLNEGKYEVRIYSDSQIDLDSIMIYPVAEENDTNIKNNYGRDVSSAVTIYDNGALAWQNLQDIFYDKAQDGSVTSQSSSHSTPTNAGQAGYIAEYKKVNPTKHELKIENATEPFMISFAESYDPLWLAYASDADSDNINTADNYKGNLEDSNKVFKISSIPLYSIINGFYINKTGDYTLTIEYQPQKWFVEGSTVSIAAAFLSLSFLIVRRMGRR
jgi:hypothetical protein